MVGIRKDEGSSYQLSVISYQSSVISGQWKVESGKREGWSEVIRAVRGIVAENGNRSRNQAEVFIENDFLKYGAFFFGGQNFECRPEYFCRGLGGGH